jgi:hypothetical protein
MDGLKDALVVVVPLIANSSGNFTADIGLAISDLTLEIRENKTNLCKRLQKTTLAC